MRYLRSLIPSYIRDSTAAVVVYDVSSNSNYNLFTYDNRKNGRLKNMKEK